MERPRPDPEALLAHEAFLRRIARPLVRDDAGVDDVVQETWLTALQKQPRDASRLRQWLGAVARNLALRARRAEERRARREQAAAKPEHDDVVARVARHQKIVDAVLSLDEPYRTAVLLHFYDGLTSDEIGARSGVSGAAVRKRLAKALELLRTKLDDLHGGDRRAWSAVLLPFFLPRPGTAALVGGIVMGTKAKLGLAAALLVALLGTVWTVVRRPNVPERSDPVAAHVGPATEAAGDAVPPDPLPSPVDFALVDRDRDVHGVVVRRDGTPIPGAVVEAVYLPWRRVLHTNHLQRFDERVGPTARTAADGTFALRLDWGDVVQLRATAAGLATADVPLIQAGERVRIVLAPPVRLTVRVRAVAGPLAGARVRLVLGEEGPRGPGIDLITDRRQREVMTGEDGVAAWDDLPDQGRVSLYVTHRLHASVNRYVDLAAAERDVEIALEPGFAIRGRVLDAATMQGIADAVVDTLGSGPKETKTDAEGRYSMAGLESIMLKATAPGYVAAGLQVGQGWHQQRWPERWVGKNDEIDFHLVRAEVVTGRIVDPQGASVAGAHLAVGSPAILSISGVSGPDGRFRFEGPWSARVPSGEQRGEMAAAPAGDAGHQIRIFAKGHGRAKVSFDARKLDLGDIVLPPAGAIEGRVLTPEGDPVPGAPVLLQSGMMESRRTDDLGRFRFPDLEPGSYLLSTQPDGAPSLERAVELPEGGRVVADLRYESWRRFTVHVRTEDGAPVAGAIARVATGFRMAQATTGADGDATMSITGTPRFASAEPPKLTGDVRFRQPFLTHLEGHETEATLVLVLEGIVRGRVESPEGTPVTMARLEVRQGGKKVGYGGTGENEFFEIQVPREGMFDLVLTGRNDYEPNESRILRGEIPGLRAGATGLVLKARAVEATRTLRVRVLAPDGTPTEAPVFASPTARPFFVSTQDGVAELGGLPAEEVRVQAGRPSEWSWAPAPPILVVPAGQEVTLRFRKAATVVGSVLLPDGSPATQTYLHAYRGKEELASVTTEADGTFRMAFEPDTEGPIRLEARRDLPTEREHVAVLEGVAPGATGVELRLSAAR